MRLLLAFFLILLAAVAIALLAYQDPGYVLIGRGHTTVETLGRLLACKGCEDYRPGPAAKAGTPFSLWKGPSVGAEDEARFKAYGAGFAT